MSDLITSEDQGIAKEYSEVGFWEKTGKFAKVAGLEVVEKALWLYYAAEKPTVPPKVKAAIYGALGYFILPFDAILDITPIVGFADDLGVLAAAVSVAAFHIDQDVKDLSSNKLRDWFGD